MISLRASLQGWDIESKSGPCPCLIVSLKAVTERLSLSPIMSRGLERFMHYFRMSGRHLESRGEVYKSMS